MKTLILTLTLALAASAQFNNRRAPGFSIPEIMTQRQVDLMDFRGKVVVLDIMKTDCPRCKSLTATLEGLKSKLGDKVQVLSVVTMPDNQKTVAGYLAENKVTSPILFDCGNVIVSYLKLSPKNPTLHTPSVFVIDRNGMIRSELIGDAATGAAVTAAIDAALK